MALNHLGWKAADISYLSSFVAGATTLCHGLLLPYFVRTRGVFKTFKLSSCGSISSFLLMSQCWRPPIGWQRSACFVAVGNTFDPAS